MDLRSRHEKTWLEADVARRMQDNLLIQDPSTHALANLAAARDNETGQHIIRTQVYVELLANHLATHERFQAALAGPRLELTVKAAPLHDLGKVGIPDAILLKPGRLTAEEMEVMKTHPVIGAAAIEKAIAQVVQGMGNREAEHAGDACTFLRIASGIALGHHEKWDGQGYSAGLAGDAIPVSARLMALADVLDAIISRRIYKPPMDLEATTGFIRDGRGSHFDPAVVDAFLACRERFAGIATRYPEEEHAAEKAARARPEQSATRHDRARPTRQPVPDHRVNEPKKSS